MSATKIVINGKTIEIGGGDGTLDHSQLNNRDLLDQHPIEAISGLRDKLDSIEEALKNVQKPQGTGIVSLANDKYGAYKANIYYSPQFVYVSGAEYADVNEDVEYVEGEVIVENANN